MKFVTKSQKSILLFFSLLIIGLVVFWYQPFFVRSEDKDYVLVNAQTLKLLSYKTPVSLRILSKYGERNNHYKLEIIPLFGKITSIELPGFEKEVILSQSEKVGDSDFLFFTGAVGAHSENMVVIKINNPDLAIIQFGKDDQRDLSLVSDWPKFNVQSQSSLDISAFYRDYEKDPLTNSLEKRYHLENNYFLFY